jgi:hypothetical protein
VTAANGFLGPPSVVACGPRAIDNDEPKEDPMICPHCNQTIREEERYLMARDSEAQWPGWAAPAMWVMLFLFLVATLTLFSHVVST